MATEGKTPSAGREEGESNRVMRSEDNAEGAKLERDDSNRGGGARSSLTGSLQKSARTLTREIKREGRRLVSDATDSATSVAAQKQGVAAGYLRTVGDAITSSCDVLDDGGYRGTSGFVRQVAEEIGALADNLEDKNPRDLLAEVKNYARANPAIFLSATLLAGFGIVRLLKNDDDSDDGSQRSAHDQEQDDHEDGEADERDSENYEGGASYDDSLAQQRL